MNLLLSVAGAIGAAAAAVTLPGSVELFAVTAASLLPRRTGPKRAPTSPWFAAVVVPAHNEQASIESCVHSLLAAHRGDIQVDIYVIADNCTDATAQVAKSAGARVLVRNNDQERGKGYALNFAFNKLQRMNYSCLLVVDADTTVSSNFILKAAGAMRHGADGVQVSYLVRNLHDSVRTRLMGLALSGFNVVRPRGRDRLGISAGILGNGFGLRSETLASVPYLASSVVEDLEYHIALVSAGYKIRFISDTTVFGEIPVQGEGVKTQRSRWEGGRLRMLYGKSPQLLAGVLRGRLTLLEPLMELLLLPLALHVALLTLAVCAPIPLIRDLGAAGLAIVVLHLFAAVLVGGAGWSGLAVIAAAPFYVLWKLTMMPALFRNARSGHAWVRTRRNAEPKVSVASQD